jgi:hypothetical protein
MQESFSSRILVSKKGRICIRRMDVCTRNLWQKAERVMITGSDSTTRFPRASCFKKPMRSVPELWGRMYDILAWSANGVCVCFWPPVPKWGPVRHEIPISSPPLDDIPSIP